jgi:mono/diheme cytochrome c family protein
VRRRRAAGRVSVRRSSGALLLGVAALAWCGVALPAQETKSVKTGVYSAAQADRGQAVFRSQCASCHAPNRFTDDLFYTSFAGKPLWEMFDVISDSMPEDNPGSLKKEEYADVIAYLLKLNNFPAGQSDLPIDREALSAIMMEKPSR